MGLAPHTVLVLVECMSIYSEALAAYFKRADAKKQDDIAARAKCTQAAVSRYATGLRFPPREVAEEIAAATDQAVPMTLWRVVAAERAGLAA